MIAHGRWSRREFLVGVIAAGAAVTSASRLAAAASPAESVPMPDGWQIGCYTRPWANLEWRAALDAIADAGYKFAGLMTAKSKTGLILSCETTLEEARQVGEEARRRGLAIPSVYGGNIPVAKSLADGILGLKKLIDTCAAAGAWNLMMGGVGDPKLQETYYKAIAECCDYGVEKKVGISVKPHGGLNATGPQCRKIIEQVGQKNFRLWYDPGNIYFYSDGQRDPVADAAAVDGLVIGMSVKDYQPPKRVDVTPGTGKVNFAAVLARLKQGGFTHGPLIVECLAPGDTAATIEEAKKARGFLEELTGAKV